MTPTPKDLRRHPRCEEATGMIFTLLNETEEHIAIAKNYSRSGMFFESDRDLRIGTSVVLRPLDCGTESDGDSGLPRPYYCAGKAVPTEACRELRIHTVAKVNRSTNLGSRNGIPRYGIAVEFLQLIP